MFFYHAIVRSQVRKIFAKLSAGDWQSAVAGMADRFEHIFPGEHALGGIRHSKAGLTAWFKRLFTVHPVLRFQVKHIASSGTPWDTTAVIEWRDTAIMADGDTSYVNDGVHVIRLKWGKIVSLHPYLDTQKYAAALNRLAGTGLAEAGAAPIED
jgi:ketosteroid isomerase-like protein